MIPSTDPINNEYSTDHKEQVLYSVTFDDLYSICTTVVLLSIDYIFYFWMILSLSLSLSLSPLAKVYMYFWKEEEGQTGLS